MLHTTVHLLDLLDLLDLFPLYRRKARANIEIVVRGR